MPRKQYQIDDQTPSIDCWGVWERFCGDSTPAEFVATYGKECVSEFLVNVAPSLWPGEKWDQFEVAAALVECLNEEVN